LASRFLPVRVRPRTGSPYGKAEFFHLDGQQTKGIWAKPVALGCSASSAAFLGELGVFKILFFIEE